MNIPDGVFLPDRLVVTILLGLVIGWYYLRERKLVPLMLTHWFVGLRSFGVFFLR